MLKKERNRGETWQILQDFGQKWRETRGKTRSGTDARERSSREQVADELPPLDGEDASAMEEVDYGPRSRPIVQNITVSSRAYAFYTVLRSVSFFLRSLERF